VKSDDHSLGSFAIIAMEKKRGERERE